MRREAAITRFVFLKASQTLFPSSSEFFKRFHHEYRSETQIKKRLKLPSSPQLGRLQLDRSVSRPWQSRRMSIEQTQSRTPANCNTRPLLQILHIHRQANISRSLAELSATRRHKDEDIPPQSALLCGVRSEQPITGGWAEETRDRKSIRGAGH